MFQSKTAHADQINAFVFIGFLSVSLSGRGEKFVEAGSFLLCGVPELSFSEQQSCQEPGSSRAHIHTRTHTHHLHINLIPLDESRNRISKY